MKLDELKFFARDVKDEEFKIGDPVRVIDGLHEGKVGRIIGFLTKRMAHIELSRHEDRYVLVDDLEHIDEKDLPQEIVQDKETA